MRRALAIAVSLVLLAWGAAVFHAQVTRVAPDAGIDWVDTARGVIAGFGLRSYTRGLDALVDLVKDGKPAKGRHPAKDTKK